MFWCSDSIWLLYTLWKHHIHTRCIVFGTRLRYWIYMSFLSFKVLLDDICYWMVQGPGEWLGQAVGCPGKKWHIKLQLPLPMFANSFRWHDIFSKRRSNYLGTSALLWLSFAFGSWVMCSEDFWTRGGSSHRRKTAWQSCESLWRTSFECQVRWFGWGPVFLRTWANLSIENC